jgi:transcriptional regulator with XRE-family HTH domain
MVSKQAQSDFRKAVSSRLKNARVNTGTSVEVASRSLEITTDQLKKIENGKTDISLVLFYRLCELYDIEADQILEGF